MLLKKDNVTSIAHVFLQIYTHKLVISKVCITSSYTRILLFSDEGPPCTCPLCASDWSSCVPHSEGLQLSRDLGATYLELPSLNHVFVGRYFGSVVSDDATLESELMLWCVFDSASPKKRKTKTHLTMFFSFKVE